MIPGTIQASGRRLRCRGLLGYNARLVNLPGKKFMPIYAYSCSSCGLQKDVMQKINDEPLSFCPQCGQQAFTKQLTAASFLLKGSGYYVTDFKSGAPKQGQEKREEGKPESGKSEAAQPESVSAPKPETAAPANTVPASGTS